MKKLIIAFLLFAAVPALAQIRGADESIGLSYDISASTGTRSGASYTEVNLGLNWALSKNLTWRNSLFSRQGANIPAVQGLDSSMRYQVSMQSESGKSGVEAFFGPGVRMATKKYNAAFAEAGVVFNLAGLRLGGGVKGLQYFSDRDTGTGPLPKSETQYFIVLSGGGSL